jgi:hypothetical protein
MAPATVFAASALVGDETVDAGFSVSGLTVGGVCVGLVDMFGALLASEKLGSGGRSGIFGTSGKLSESGVIAAEEFAGGLEMFDDPALAGPLIGGGTGQVFPASAAALGHCGAVLPDEAMSPFHAGLGVSDAGPFAAGAAGGAVSGGTPAALCAASFASGTRWAGFSLIFVYRNTPAAIRIEIVISGRMEFIVRPP